MRGHVTKTLNGLEIAIEALLGALIGAFTLIILLDVVCRYCLHVPLAWPAELTIVLFQWLVFLGTPLMLRRGLHFHVDAFIIWMPEKPRKAISLLVAIGVLGAASVLVIVGRQLAMRTADSMYTTLPMSHSVLYFSVVACGLLTVIFTIEHVINAFGSQPEAGR